jgi:histidine triad (HIT) family protein
MARRDWYCEDVLSGKLEIRKVWEDARVLAFHHPSPQAEIHVVVIPKAHIPSLLDALALDGTLLCSMLQAIQAAAEALRLDKTGFYVRANVAGVGVTPHMHWHIIGPGIP